MTIFAPVLGFFGTAIMFSTIALAQKGSLKAQIAMHPAYKSEAYTPTTSTATTGPYVFGGRLS
ncbi:MAG: hypothetical protein WB992_22870 [Bryobacteraceae bacterium]